MGCLRPLLDHEGKSLSSANPGLQVDVHSGWGRGKGGAQLSVRACPDAATAPVFSRCGEQLCSAAVGNNVAMDPSEASTLMERCLPDLTKAGLPATAAADLGPVKARLVARLWGGMGYVYELTASPPTGPLTVIAKRVRLPDRCESIGDQRKKASYEVCMPQAAKQVVGSLGWNVMNIGGRQPTAVRCGVEIMLVDVVERLTRPFNATRLVVQVLAGSGLQLPPTISPISSQVPTRPCLSFIQSISRSNLVALTRRGRRRRARACLRAGPVYEPTPRSCESVC